MYQQREPCVIASLVKSITVIYNSSKYKGCTCRKSSLASRTSHYCYKCRASLISLVPSLNIPLPLCTCTHTHTCTHAHMHMHTHTHTHINTQAHTHGEILMTQVASDTAPHESSARQLPVNQSGMLSRPSWHLSCAISMMNNSSLFSVLMSAHRSLHLHESS